MRIQHTDFIEAVTPLLTLIGQDANSLYVPMTITVANSDDQSASLSTITVLRAEDPLDGTEPITHGDGDFAVLAWPLTIEVV